MHSDIANCILAGVSANELFWYPLPWSCEDGMQWNDHPPATFYKSLVEVVPFAPHQGPWTTDTVGGFINLCIYAADPFAFAKLASFMLKRDLKCGWVELKNVLILLPKKAAKRCLPGINAIGSLGDDFDFDRQIREQMFEGQFKCCLDALHTYSDEEE